MQPITNASSVSVIVSSPRPDRSMAVMMFLFPIFSQTIPPSTQAVLFSGSVHMPVQGFLPLCNSFIFSILYSLLNSHSLSFTAVFFSRAFILTDCQLNSYCFFSCCSDAASVSGLQNDKLIRFQNDFFSVIPQLSDYSEAPLLLLPAKIPSVTVPAYFPGSEDFSHRFFVYAIRFFCSS